MTAYLRLVLLRLGRQRVVFAGTLGALVIPGLLGLRLRLEAGSSPEKLFLVCRGLATMLCALAVVNIVAFVIHEERTRNRVGLLRIARVDGTRAAASYVALGVLAALWLAATGMLGPAVLGLGTGLGLGPWARSAAAAALFAAALAPIAVAVAYLLPRAVGGLVLNLIALVGAWVFVAAGAWSVAPLARLAAAVAFGEAGSLVLLGVLWQRTSTRLW